MLSFVDNKQLCSVNGEFLDLSQEQLLDIEAVPSNSTEVWDRILQAPNVVEKFGQDVAVVLDGNSRGCLWSRRAKLEDQFQMFDQHRQQHEAKVAKARHEANGRGVLKTLGSALRTLCLVDDENLNFIRNSDINHWAVPTTY